MALLAGTASASAAVVANGDFETGSIAGWTATAGGGGESGWIAYNRHEYEEHGGLVAPAAPPSGEWAATTVNPIGTAATEYLYQDVALPPGTNDQLSMYLYYRSDAPMAVPTPDTLFVAESPPAQPNQQVRVDVLKPNAPIESLSPNDILATVFASKSGDPQELQPTVVGADLSAFAGQTVRLRIADAAQQGRLEVGVDGVSIAATPLPVIAPPVQPIATPLPSNSFLTGKLTLDRKHGAARLLVTLPDAGTLTVADARRKIAVASARRTAGRKKPVLIRTTSVETSGPQTVRVTLRPTKAARKLLARTGKLRFRLQLTFTPDGGQAATRAYKGTLVKRLGRPRR